MLSVMSICCLCCYLIYGCWMFCCLFLGGFSSLRGYFDFDMICFWIVLIGVAILLCLSWMRLELGCFVI